MKTAKTYELFERDGAIFRREKGYIGVSEVQDSAGKWSAYTGDRMKPVTFGDKIGEETAAAA